MWSGPSISALYLDACTGVLPNGDTHELTLLSTPDASFPSSINPAADNDSDGDEEGHVPAGTGGIYIKGRAILSHNYSDIIVNNFKVGNYNDSINNLITPIYI